MHLLHHVSLFHVWSQNSSKYVAPCASCGEYTASEDTRIFEFPRTTIKPNPMLFHLYIVILQLFVEQLKAMLYKIQVMTPVIAYVKVILLQYNPFLFSTIFPMSIGDMDHYASLV